VKPFVAFVGLVAFVATSKTVLAAPTSRLVYVRGPGAEGCADEAALRSAVAARLGYDPFRPHAAISLFADLRRERDVYRARVSLIDEKGVERGTRDLESHAADCSDITSAMALSMSIAIDPLSMMRKAAAADAPTTSDPPAADPLPSRDDAVPAVTPPGASPNPPETRLPSSSDLQRDRPDPWRFALGAGAHGALGVAPGVAFGVRLSTELATRRFALGVEGRLDLPASAESAEGGRVRASFAGGAFVPCMRVEVARLWACGLVLLGRASTEAYEISAPRSDAFFYWGAGARLAFQLGVVEGYAVRFVGDVLAHPSAFDLTVNGRSVFQSSAISGALGIGLVRIF
jgi:hypothetical protein